ncbi:hypothetical protein [Mycobacterium shottsii]|uniref:hypothetical protein n=1 Tax=Mycobacterium shottsii TaxID=133549 RepID=UPI0018E923E4|nr:hypothetical protein [Mycobacterium shottsii]
MSPWPPSSPTTASAISRQDLVQDDAEPDTATLRPGLVVLVAFDPADRQQLSLPDDVLAVRARGLAIG